ncbi:MAG TPA: hypothetical protein VGL76_00470, partial [Gaiellaceae bacterium]
AALVAALAAVAVAAADPLDPKTKLNAADQSAAKAALLTKADLGAGWTTGPTVANLKTPRCPALQPNFHDLTLTAHVESDFFLQSAGWQIDSDVTVLKTAKQVATQYKRLFQPGLTTCIKYDVLKSTGSDPNIKLGFTKRVSFPKLATVAALYRTTIFDTVGKQTVAVLDDTIFLSKGRTQLWLNFVAPSTDQTELELREQEIAKTLLNRARV